MTEPERFYAESDGGGTHDRPQPRTHYVIDREGVATRTDCKTRREAEALAKILNAERRLVYRLYVDEAGADHTARRLMRMLTDLTLTMVSIEMGANPAPEKLLADFEGVRLYINIFEVGMGLTQEQTATILADVHAAFVQQNVEMLLKASEKGEVPDA